MLKELSLSPWQPRLSQGSEPAYVRLAQAIASDIRDGILVGGHRLPTHRALADTLGVAVKTVTRAYGELCKIGLVETVVGRGSFVRSVSGVNHINRTGKAGIDLFSHMGVTAPLQDSFRRAIHSLIKGEDLDQALMYQPAGGAIRHRRAGAHWASVRGVEATPENVVVCAGTQHAVFVALLALARSGDSIATECLAYPGVKAAADQLGLNILGLPIDEEGIIPEALEELCRRKRPPKLLIFTPTSHNPTLVTASLERRLAIATVLERHAIMFIEDDIFGHVVPSAPPPVASFLPLQGLYLCGLSKAMAPGLRTSFIVSPPNRVDALKAAIYGSMFAAPALPVEIAAQSILNGLAERMVEWHRRESSARIRILHECLPGIDVRTTRGVYLGWIALSDGIAEKKLAQQLNESGVRVAPGKAFATVSGCVRHGIRISLASNSSRRDVQNGAEILGRVLKNR